MSRLSDLVNEAIILNTRSDGSLSTHDVVLAIKPSLDDEARDTLVNEALTARITNAAKNSQSAILRQAASRNLELPFAGLHGAYPIDIDSHYVKRTEALTQAEMRRVIEIRELQIEHDINHLAELRAAYVAVEPLWDVHPDWTFGQCCNELMQPVAA